MIVAKCNGVNLLPLVGYGYVQEQIPQYGDQITAMDGTDYSAKLRDQWHITVPFIALTETQLRSVLRLFPASGAYVDWTFYDETARTERTLSFKYGVRKSALMVRYKNGTEYWSGLQLDLIER